MPLALGFWGRKNRHKFDLDEAGKEGSGSHAIDRHV